MTTATPELFLDDDRVTVWAGDSLAALRLLPDASVDAVVTDPPYGLADLPAKKVAAAMAAWVSGDTVFVPAGGTGFMGQAWDRFVPPPALWAECFRVMKPGAYLASFAGTRTQDLMGISIRLAGFRMKDGLQWLRSDVFPKTKHGLKPGYEPVLLAQKPLEGTIAQNVAAHGTGGLNVDSVRTVFVSESDRAETVGKNQHAKYGTVHGGNTIYGDFSGGGAREDYAPEGRWPTNLMLDDGAAAELDASTPPSKSRKGKPNRASQAGDGWGMNLGGTEYDDAGGASRFYPRLNNDPEIDSTEPGDENDTLTPRFHYAGRATVKERPKVDGVAHTTVKPLSVMDWLIRLTTPEGGLVLDPFLGSGTTAEAALRAGRRCVGVEGHAPYLPLIAARVARVPADGVAAA